MPSGNCRSATSIAGLLLHDPVLNDADYILGSGADTRVHLGALCEIFLDLERSLGIATAVSRTVWSGSGGSWSPGAS